MRGGFAEAWGAAPEASPRGFAVPRQVIKRAADRRWEEWRPGRRRGSVAEASSLGLPASPVGFAVTSRRPKGLWRGGRRGEADLVV